MTSVEHVYAAAQALTPEERLELAQMLLDAAEEPPEGWWEGIRPDVERRLAAVDSGESSTIPWDEVRKRVSERLNGTRDSLL